jgi:HEAT repeat protein
MSLTFEEVLRLAQLIDPDPQDRGLELLDSSAIPHLEALIVEGDVHVATRAASLATLIEDAAAVRILIGAADSPHEEVRLAAAAGAWQLARVGVDELLARLLRDPDSGVQRFALRSTARRVAMPAAEPPAEDLGQQVGFLAARGGPLVRELASSVLRRLQGEPPSREEVLGALGSRWFGEDAADVLGPGALDQLAALAREQDPNIAARAVELAALLSGAARLDAVTAAARHPHPEVRDAAAESLRRVLDSGSEAVLVELLHDGVPEVRRNALASAVRHFDESGVREAVEELAEGDLNPDVRRLAQVLLRGRGEQPLG